MSMAAMVRRTAAGKPHGSSNSACSTNQSSSDYRVVGSLARGPTAGERLAVGGEDQAARVPRAAPRGGARGGRTLECKPEDNRFISQSYECKYSASGGAHPRAEGDYLEVQFLQTLLAAPVRQ